MSKIETGPTARVLRDDELDAVNGGIHDVEAVAIQDLISQDSWYHEVDKAAARR
jgi:hypothetical protein